MGVREEAWLAGWMGVLPSQSWGKNGLVIKVTLIFAEEDGSSGRDEGAGDVPRGVMLFSPHLFSFSCASSARPSSPRDTSTPDAPTFICLPSCPLTSPSLTFISSHPPPHFAHLFRNFIPSSSFSSFVSSSRFYLPPCLLPFLHSSFLPSRLSFSSRLLTRLLPRQPTIRAVSGTSWQADRCSHRRVVDLHAGVFVAPFVRRAHAS